MPEPTDSPQGALPEPPPVPLAQPVPNAEFKAVLLLLLLALLVFGSAIYLMYARGAFESTQKLVLQADDAEGVAVGMDLTFAGFPVGRVNRIELSADGKARMIIQVPRKDAHWLRSSSVFTLERALVGATRLRAFSGILTDPPLQDGALRTLLVGDTNAEIPRVLAAAKELLQNLVRLSAADSPLDATLHHIQGASGKLNGPNGAVGMLLGDDARLLVERTTALLATMDQMAGKADSLIGNADRRVFGQGGAMTDAQAALVQLNALLQDARASVKKMDAVLAEAQAVGANARIATADLGTLRGEVDSNLRRIEQLVNEINRKWPFARDTEIRLP